VFVKINPRSIAPWPSEELAHGPSVPGRSASRYTIDSYYSLFHGG